MSVALPCPHCHQAVVPRLRPVGMKTALDPMADMRRQDLSAGVSCPECHQAFTVQGIWNEQGQFERVTAVEGIHTDWSPCTICRHTGLKRIETRRLFLPPTGGDFEWVDINGECFCPICAQVFEASVRVWPDQDRWAIDRIEPRNDWWSEQFVLAEVSYKRGEIYTIGTVRAFRHESQLQAFWARWSPLIAPQSTHPEAFDFRLLRYADDRYWDADGALQ